VNWELIDQRGHKRQAQKPGKKKHKKTRRKGMKDVEYSIRGGEIERTWLLLKELQNERWTSLGRRRRLGEIEYSSRGEVKMRLLRCA